MAAAEAWAAALVLGGQRVMAAVDGRAAAPAAAVVVAGADAVAANGSPWDD